jgi:hypothetical protein
MEDVWMESFESSEEFYLQVYDEVYRDLMGASFNPMWTPDTTAVNDLDFKDDFGSVSYLIFNLFLIRRLSDKADLHVIDRTKKKFRHQRRFYQFLRKNGILLTINSEKLGQTSFKNRQKKRVFGLFKRLKQTVSGMADCMKRELASKTVHPGKPANGETIYFYLHPHGNMGLEEYVNWRYSDVLNQIETENRNVIFFSTRDFEHSNKFRYPFVNIRRLTLKKDLLSIYLHSIFLKLKVRIYKEFKQLKSSDIARSVFLDHLPTGFFTTLQEYEGLARLFDTYGKGVLFIKGPVNNKGVSLLNAKAKDRDIRVCLIQPRILTRQRYSNQYVPAQVDPAYPSLIPDVMVTFDQISTKTVYNQTKKIKIYPFQHLTEISDTRVVQQKNENLRITLILQRSDEVPVMVDHVVNALDGMDGVTLYLKEHPVLKAPKEIHQRFAESSWINILNGDVSVREAIELSDLCISSYSSAALEFAASGCPIIWMKNVTLNSLFFSDIHDTVGIVTRNSDELCEIIHHLKRDPDFLEEVKQKQLSTVREQIFHLGEAYRSDFGEVLRNEMAMLTSI